MGKNKYYCRINGRIENLKDIQDILDGVSQEDITMTMCHKYGFDPLDALQFEDVIEFNNNEIPADYNECLERMKARNRSTHKNSPTIKCPICGSTNVGPLSTFERLLGAFSMGRSRLSYVSMECKHCGYMW